MVENFINQNSSPENAELLLSIYALLIDQEVDDLESKISNVIFSEAEASENDALSELREYFRQCLLTILNQHGILLIDDVTLDDVYTLVNAVFELSDFENPDALVRVTESDDDDLTQFTNILNLVDPTPPEHWDTLIESVSPFLLLKIKSLVDQGLTQHGADESVAQSTEQYVNNFTRLTQYLGNTYSQVATALKRGKEFGLPFSSYIDDGVINLSLDKGDVKNAAIELFLAALVSKDGSDNPLSFITDHIENYIYDLTRITQVQSEISKLNLGMASFGSTKVSTAPISMNGA